MTLPEAIKTRQSKLKWSNVILAEKSGVSRHTIRAMKNNDNVELLSVYRVCNALDLTPDFRCIPEEIEVLQKPYDENETIGVFERLGLEFNPNKELNDIYSEYEKDDEGNICCPFCGETNVDTDIMMCLDCKEHI